MMTQPHKSPPSKEEKLGVRSRLRAILETDLAGDQIVLSKGKVISRLYYAKALGCSPSRMSQLVDVFTEFEGRTRLINKRQETSLALKLHAALEADVETGNIQISRSGKINRAYYAKKIGHSPTVLQSWTYIFNEFEHRLNVVTGPLRHLPEMRRWLEQAFETGEIGVRDGKVDRTAFCRRFSIRGGSFMTRFPEIRALIEEYDNRVTQEGYLPSSDAKYLERLHQALSAGPPLCKDRLTINKLALSVAIDIPKGRLRAHKFAEVIEQAQDAVRDRAMESKIDPMVHGRVFPFRDISSQWPVPFLERLGQRLKVYLASFAAGAAKVRYLQLLAALRWIGDSDNPHCRTVVQHAATRSIPDAAWEESLYAYREHLLAGIASGSSSHSRVDAALKLLRVMIDFLADGKIVPEMSVPLAGVKYARRRMTPLRSVAEVGLSQQGEYLDFARARFFEACQLVGSEMATGETDLFFQGLSAELSVAADLPDNAAAAVLAVLERRLTLLSDNARSIVQQSADDIVRGAQILRLATIDPMAFTRDYFGSHLARPDKIKLLRENFPDPKKSSESETRRSLANLLTLINWQHKGVPPRSVDKAQNGTGAFYAKRYLEHGGLPGIERYLVPSSDAVGATLVLYMIESGSNVGVARTLDRSCLEKSDLAGHYRIFGHKARAKGKPIIVDLPESSSAVWSIKWLLEVGGLLVNQASEDSDMLYLMRIGARVQLMEPHWLTNWFKKFASSTIDSPSLVFTPNMIRPSVLLRAALSNDGRLATGIALGQHGSQVSQGYQQKYPTRLLYDENIRRFQTTFETLVMSGVADAAMRLGITADQFEARLGNLRPTGLGTFCKDFRGRPEAQTSKCASMDCWNDCPNLLIVAEVEAIAQFQLWQKSLREVQPDWERDRPERWDQVWLPWLCLADVIEEKMTRGPLSAVWKRAAARSSTISSDPNFQPPRPW